MTSYDYRQDKISQELSMGTKIFKTSYYTVLRAFSSKKIKILMTVQLQQGLLNLERARSTDVFRSYLRFSKRYVDENSTIRFSVKIYTNS